MAEEGRSTTQPDPTPSEPDEGTWEPIFAGNIHLGFQNSVTGERRAEHPDAVARREEREAAGEALPKFVIQTGGETIGSPTIRRGTGGGFGEDWVRRWTDPDDPSYNPGFDLSMLQDENGVGITFFAVNPLGEDTGQGGTFVSSDGKWTMTTGSFPSPTNPYGRHASLTGPGGTFTDNYWGVVQPDGDVPGGGAIAMNLGQPIAGDVAGYPAFYEPWGDGSSFAPGTSIASIAGQQGWDLKGLQGSGWQRQTIPGASGQSLYGDLLNTATGTPPPPPSGTPDDPYGGPPPPGGEDPGNFPSGPTGPGQNPSPTNPSSGQPDPWNPGGHPPAGTPWNPTGAGQPSGWGAYGQGSGTGYDPYGGNGYRTGGTAGTPYQQPVFNHPSQQGTFQSGSVDTSGFVNQRTPASGGGVGPSADDFNSFLQRFLTS